MSRGDFSTNYVRAEVNAPSSYRQCKGRQDSSIYTDYAEIKSCALVEMRLKEPLPSRSLSTREKIILLESSRLNGYRFPPWQNSPDTAEFELGEDQSLFTFSAFSDAVGCLQWMEAARRDTSLVHSHNECEAESGPGPRRDF
ncbi:MAG: hypothetical protein Q9171_001246 [Xanthocarpia ochracea]